MDADRGPARYWGSLTARDQGSAAEWPATGPEPTLFAYLKADYGPIEAVLQALQAAPLRTLAHVAGLRPELRRRFANDRLRFSDGPVAMTQAMAGASAVLCHAGSGTVCTALQAGLPVLMLPMHAEQLLFARRVVDAGAGIAMVEASVAEQLPGALVRLAQQPALRAAAQALAERQVARQYGDVALQVALRCEALAGGH